MDEYKTPQGTFSIIYKLIQKQPLFVTSQAQLCAQSVIMTANSTISSLCVSMLFPCTKSCRATKSDAKRVVSKFSPWTSASPDVPVMQYIRCCGSPGAGFRDYKTSRFRPWRKGEPINVWNHCMPCYISIPTFFLVLLALCNPNGNKYNLYIVGIQKKKNK